MNHLEAQSYIMPFIEGRLPDHKQLEFVMHMKTCRTCHDELEIYFTLINGMQQEEQPGLTGNFPKDLENKLGKIEHRAKGRRRMRFSTFSIITMVLLLLMILFYGRCLNSVYAFEQETKFSMQGQNYFYRMVGDLIRNPNNRIRDDRERKTWEEENSDVTIYDRVKGYQKMEQDAVVLWSLGQEVVREKAGTRETEEEDTSEETEGEH